MPYYFLAVLVFSFFGFIILRQIMESIVAIADNMANQARDYLNQEDLRENELENISLIAKSIDKNLKTTTGALERKMNEIIALRDLSALSFSVFEGQTLLSRSIDKAREATNAPGGAFFSFSNNSGKTILKCSSISGEGLRIKVDDIIPLEQHPAKSAIESSEPMLISRSESPYWNTFFPEYVDQIAAIPLFQDGEFKGVVILINSNISVWQPEILHFLTTYFNTVNTALKFQELSFKEREKAEELKTILYIIKMINSGISEENLILAIAERLDEVIPHHWVALAKVDETNGELKLFNTFRRSLPEIREGMVFPESSSFCCSVMKSRGIISLPDINEGQEFFERDMLSKLGMRSAIFAGLNFKGKGIGSLCLAHSQKDAFSKKHSRILTIIADGLALALEQGSLLRKAQIKSSELQVLNRIGRALTSSTFHMERVLTYILEMISGLVNAEAGSVLLLEGDSLVFKAVTGEAEECLKGCNIKFGQGVAGWVAATGEPLMVKDVDENPHFFPGMDDKTGFKTKDLLCTPMIASGRTMGVIELFNKRQGTFNEEDLRILKSVASSAAIALENSRLYYESNQIAKKERLIRNIFQKYVPEEVVNEILDNGETDQTTIGEKRIVTLFNVDIRGYSTLSKTAKVEDVVGVLNYFFMSTGNIILKHKGMLDKYLGDGLLAVFGAPVATRNPALDATLAAIDIIETIDKVSSYSLERCGTPLSVGVSINTGEAIVGNIGFEKKMEYTAIGDVVNDTFRLQKFTKEKPNSVLISQSTFLKVKPFVRSQSLGIKKLGDYGNEMEVFQILGKNEMSHIQHLSPLAH